MMDDLSEADFQKEEEPASPAPPPSQQQTDPASPTVAVTPEPVARGDQATPRENEYQVNKKKKEPMIAFNQLMRQPSDSC